MDYVCQWPRAIPRRIHLSVKHRDDIPRSVIENWETLNPGFEVVVHGDAECMVFLESCFGKSHLKFFQSIRDGAIKCDFWRACFMYQCGGVYADADTRPVVSLSELVTSKLVFLTSGSSGSVWGEECVNPIIIIAQPRLSLLLDCINSMLRMQDRAYKYWDYSICYHLAKQLKELILAFAWNQSRVYDLQDGQYKFLHEDKSDETTGPITKWENTLVMYNHNPSLWVHGKGFINAVGRRGCGENASSLKRKYARMMADG